MTGCEVIAAMQEGPDGKPWESEAVRTWDIAPFDPVIYERWARMQALGFDRDQIIPQPASMIIIDDPTIDPGITAARRTALKDWFFGRH